MKKLYAILYFSLLILQSFAQQYTVTGKVSRESDNKRLKGAHVYIRNNDGTEILTDEKKYEPYELQEIIDDMNKQIDLIREENGIHYHPLPCPECPPIEKKLRNTL